MRAERRRVIPLPDDWRGKTVGFLDNAKASFDLLLGKLAEVLRQHYEIADIGLPWKTPVPIRPAWLT